MTSAVEDVDKRIRAALQHGALDEAATLAVRAYGPELLGFLAALVPGEAQAQDLFSQLCEDVWTGLPGFRGDSSVRTWAYTLAHHAAVRYLRQPARWRLVPLSRHPALSAVAEEVRTATQPFLRTDVKERFQGLRRQLAQEDQALLILRVDRGLSWLEVARILEEAEPAPTADLVRRRAAALRKRFERLKEELRQRAIAEGLLEDA